MGRSTTPLPIVYYVPLHRDYIQISLFLGILEWESQNLDSYYPQNFGCSYISQIKFDLKIWGQYLIAIKNFLPMVYNMLQSDLIWFLLSKDLWSKVKFPIWLPSLLLIITHKNRYKWTMKGTLSIYAWRYF